MKRSRVLVTGASGFLGRYVCSKLSACDYEVIQLSSADGCIADPKTLENIGKIEFVIHLAGILSVEDSWKNPQYYNQINVNGTVNVLNLCRKYDAEIIYCSSYVYGIPQVLPISENHPTFPTNPYMLSKLMAEHICRMYHERYGLKCKIIRPFNVYGPGQSKKLLLGSIISQVDKSRSVSIRNWKTRRDFVHVSDLADAVKLSLISQSDFEIFNIGSGISTSVLKILKIIEELKGNSIKYIESDTNFVDPIVDCYADITCAKTKLNWKPKINLRQGLEELL